MTFPTNNLPTQSKYWGREVEKKITNLESSLRSSEINNTTRDSQLSVTAGQALTAANNATAASAAASAAAAQAQVAADDAADAAALAQTAANNAQAAIDGLGSLDEATSTFKINASNITVGTLNADLITTGTLSADRISGGAINGVGNITSGGVIYATGNLGAGGNLGLTGSIFMSGSIDCGGSITRTGLSGGGTTGASFTNSGSLVRTTSSRRYKTDIQPLELNLTDLYGVEPKTFKRIEEVQEDPESARVYPGFIAEELAGTSLDSFVFYSKDQDGNSRPEGIHYPELTTALLLAIKDLNARIEALESR
jgi:hypothetical protein